MENDVRRQFEICENVFQKLVNVSNGILVEISKSLIDKLPKPPYAELFPDVDKSNTILLSIKDFDDEFYHVSYTNDNGDKKIEKLRFFTLVHYLDKGNLYLEGAML